MSKILISFVGTGVPKDRKYRTAKYKFGEEYIESEFVAKAMKKLFNPDKIFLLGTPHSMWEEVYRSFSGKEDDTWLNIGTWCEEANHLTPADGMPHLEDIEAAIGKGSKVFVLRYGLNDEELDENIKTVLGLRKYLNNGDEIIVDITHSFRSLPILIMQLVLYLKQIESPKVNVSHVYYGMLDVIGELGYAPIVDISKMIKLSDWISGAYSFKLTGSAERICRLIENDDRPTSAILRKFSNVLSLNDLSHIQGQIQILKNMSNREYPSMIEELAVKPTVNEFIRTFGRIEQASRFQFELTKWQCRRMNYLASYTTLVECIITKVCETSNLDWRNYEYRVTVRDVFSDKITDPGLSCTQKLYDIYKKTNKLRNSIVHQDYEQQKQVSAEGKIKILKEAISALENEI